MRPATYESAAEAKVLSKWFSGRDGDLENTTFVLLDPAGKRALSRGGRSPRMMFDGANDLAKKLRDLTAQFEAKPGDRGLLRIADLRLGLNIAASDGLPLVVGIGSESDHKILRESAWQDGMQGQAHYVLLADAKPLAKFEGFAPGAGIYVLQPETFGRTGKVVAQFSASEKLLATKLLAVLPNARIKKDEDRKHVRNAHRAGISWKSAIPVSDQAAKSRQR